MSKVPGSCGFPILGDKSIDFYRDPVRFVSKNIQQNKNRVFCARFLNIPTVFIGCNETIRKLLTGTVKISQTQLISEAQLISQS